VSYLKVFVFSMVPVFELRGGFPLGILLGLTRWEALLFSVLGNVAIILPWLLVLARLEKMVIRNRAVLGLYQRLIRGAERKKDGFRKYGKYVLFLFVAVPLPTTGAWTACVAARFFRIPLRDSFLIIAAGVVTSGFIMLLAKILALSGFERLWGGAL
jgi:uncharacterized membrane protein